MAILERREPETNETPDEALAELSELAELWLERHVLGLPNVQVSVAIQQADRESRRLERKAASHVGAHARAPTEPSQTSKA